MTEAPSAPLTGREQEALLVQRCVSVARGEPVVPTDARDANVFRVASMLLGREFEVETQQLRKSSERYFVAFPSEKVDTTQVLNNGWMIGLPRFRDRLERKLREVKRGGGQIATTNHSTSDQPSAQAIEKMSRPHR